MCLFQVQRSTIVHAPQDDAENAEPRPPKNLVTAENVEKVQMLVETCLQRLYTLEETSSVLEGAPYFVDSRFTEIIWHRLEKENPEFFAGYNKVLQARLYKPVEL